MDAKPSRNPLGSLDHVVVLMLENRSFDNLLGEGELPGIAKNELKWR